MNQILLLLLFNGSFLAYCQEDTTKNCQDLVTFVFSPFELGARLFDSKSVGENPTEDRFVLENMRKGCAALSNNSWPIRIAISSTKV